MNITDKEVLKQLKIVRSYELEESVRSYPEDERDGRSDMQILADETSWRLSLYTEGGTSTGEDYEEAKEILQETKYGKVIPLNRYTLKPKYSPSRIQSAKDSVNEYRRLCSLMDRLNKKGFYGKW
jgi:hypothetical protein